MTQQLKSCPFCHRAGRIDITENLSPYSASSKWFWILCSGCAARSAVYENEELAVNAWNARYGGLKDDPTT